MSSWYACLCGSRTSSSAIEPSSTSSTWSESASAGRSSTVGSVTLHIEENQRMNLDAFPRQPLLFGPSPVHPLDRLTAHLGGARMWAKRDDVNSGLAYGGNKTRKLEYLVADALAKGCDTLVSIGGVQSNQIGRASCRERV